MSRLVDQDFARLEVFLDQYTLSGSLKSNIRKQIIKRGHKYCLASLQMWAIAEQLAKDKELLLAGIKVSATSIHLGQISECFSDITSSFFSVLHGLYKPAHMSLRSAAESFTRGVVGLYSAKEADTTSVYRLFQFAKGCDAFTGRAKVHFDELHQHYVELCKFTHSATPAHMIKNHAMSNFPKHEIEPLRVWIRHHEDTIRAILSILVIANRNLYLDASPKAQDTYEDVVPSEIRLFALGAPG